MDRYDLVLAAIPLLAAGPAVLGTLASVAAGSGPVAVSAPLAMVGLVAALALVGHQLLVSPPGADVDDS